MNKQQQILAAAKELIYQKGYENTTVRDISTLANVNVAMISYYFGSKEKLFAAMIEENATSAFNKLEYIGNTTAKPEKKLEALVTMYVDRVYTNRTFFAIINRELSTEHSRELVNHIISLHARNFDSLKKIITDGQKQKIFRSDIDIDLIIASFIGTLSEIVGTNQLLSGIYKLKYAGNKSEEQKDEEWKKRLKEHLTDLLQVFLLKK